MIELQQYAKKNKPNLHILSKLQEEMKRLAEERVSVQAVPAPRAPPHSHPLALTGGEEHLAGPHWQLWEGSQSQHFQRRHAFPCISAFMTFASDQFMF